MNSGLYSSLIETKLIIPHQEVNIQIESDQVNDVYKIIKPEFIPFISYPYEWCFSQLKDAALTTLRLLKLALQYGMLLKDSSAYNIQFKDGQPVFIDTLSFEKYIEGSPWIAYRQFCQHFLAPLVLMNYSDIRLNQLLRIYLDGVPLDLTSRLLPFKTRMSFPILSHIHLHANAQKTYRDKAIKRTDRKLSKTGLLAIIDNLETTIKKLIWKPHGTEWGDYYNHTNYSNEAASYKKQFISQCLEILNPSSVWDIGANTGMFSQLAAAKNIPVISFDIDPAAVEKNYLNCKNTGEQNILPLLLDLTNPSPGIGWENIERMSLLNRGPVDVVFALALIHHLAISNNVPFGKIARLFAGICRNLIIEFVPKTDSQVKRLLATREDIFPNYTQQAFETEFGRYFDIKRRENVKDSERMLLLMGKKA